MTEENEAPTTPEMTSYEIITTRQFEMDFSKQQIQGMMQRTGADTTEEAIEEALLQRETQHVQPEQKLIGADVQVDEASDN